MRAKRVHMCLLLTLFLLPGMTITAQAWDRGEVERFATLPPGEAYPEGICLGPDGNVYVVTVAANKPKGSPGTLLRGKRRHRSRSRMKNSSGLP